MLDKLSKMLKEYYAYKERERKARAAKEKEDRARQAIEAQYKRVKDREDKIAELRAKMDKVFAEQAELLGRDEVLAKMAAAGAATLVYEELMDTRGKVSRLKAEYDALKRDRDALMLQREAK